MACFANTFGHILAYHFKRVKNERSLAASLRIVLPLDAIFFDQNSTVADLDRSRFDHYLDFLTRPFGENATFEVRRNGDPYKVLGHGHAKVVVDLI